MTDNQKSTATPIIYILVICAIIAVLVVISKNTHVATIVNIENAKKEVFKKKKPVVFKKPAKETNVDELIATAEKKAEGKKEEKKKRASKKTISDKEYFNRIKAKYQKNVYSLLERPKDRTDLVIRYYKKDRDGEVVYSLRNLGLYIHERPSDIAYRSMSSNAIFYGDSIARRDIEIIAYTLIKAGFNLKVIAPSLYSKTWKNHSLEIGTDSTFIDMPNLKYSDIRRVWGK